ncbi:bifunctional aspartate kinase/homoserine dehydrogenase I [Buchnera aphidicola]|uniref:bifunctional aspartate kinase/homoserine dehydrogenase I n=1 Tax=Buchnera aphidicola TaxID=9 RepID=UPI00094DA5DD|nr:bifunctional aspartate kinase/homoserine dehydrogenase I [Buchnera aphidicola]
MKTLKFGGTSLANAKKFIHVSSIIIDKAKNDQISIVLSAPATITNYLEKSIKKFIKHKKIPTSILIFIKKFFLNLIQELYNINPKYPLKKIEKQIIEKYEKLNNIFKKIYLSKICSEKKQAQIISSGEIFSVIIMKSLLNTFKRTVTIINPVKTILATNSYLNATVEIPKSKKSFQKLNISKQNIILMPGFIAGNAKGELVVLGRNGSDYSAAILAICTQSTACEIWTDVNGIYTGDPNIISQARWISEITYQEALELAYFGASVIHPSTIAPLQNTNIPCIIKNTNNHNHAGTLISKQKKTNASIITGITNLKKITLIKIFSCTNFCIEKMTHKLFLYLNRLNINTYLFNQSLSNHSINFYIQERNSKNIKKDLETVFETEIQRKMIEPIITLDNLSMISIIGTNIKKYNSEILKKICCVVNKFQNTILDISHNASNTSLSFVLKNKQTDQITNKIHNLIINKKIFINIFLIGVGGVGLEFLKIFFQQREQFKKKSICLNINLIANSKKFIFNKKKIDSEEWIQKLEEPQENFDLKKILILPKKYGFLCPVLIDCTASYDIADKYNEIIKSGFHIITSNKKSNTSLFAKYKKIRETACKYNKKFFYETHVGAGLPVIQTLKSLIESGDKLVKFQGILSGSMSYIFGQLDPNNTLSDAVNSAKKLGFTEPNPQDDLSGIDVARKLLILAREAGYSLELSDIHVEQILPDDFKKTNNKTKFLSRLRALNHIFLKKSKQAKKEEKVLRFIGTINDQGICKVQLHAVNKYNPLYHIKNGENIFVFYTKYYQPIPLILRGYGAGNRVTALGVFSDLLRIIS